MSEQPSTNLSGTKIWLMAMRPKTLVLSLGPVILAGLLAWDSNGPVNWLLFPIIVMSAGAIQIATNLWNDAADASSGLDKASERLGPPRVTSLGLVSAEKVRGAAFFFLLLAALCGLYLVIVGGWPILMIGLVGILCAFGYSSGPYPISGSPFGELFVVIFFGIMSVMGSTYLLTGGWADNAFWAGCYIGLPAAAVLTVNNHRDRVGDKAGGRRTLAIQLGPERTKFFYAILMLVASFGLVHVFMVIDHGTTSFVSLLVSIILMLYAAAVPIRKLYLADGAADLNKCLAGTSMFQLVWIAAFVVILVVG